MEAFKELRSQSHDTNNPRYVFTRTPYLLLSFALLNSLLDSHTEAIIPQQTDTTQEETTKAQLEAVFYKEKEDKPRFLKEVLANYGEGALKGEYKNLVDTYQILKKVMVR